MLGTPGPADRTAARGPLEISLREIPTFPPRIIMEETGDNRQPSVTLDSGRRFEAP
jgi:hypothetical protein